MPQKLTLDLFLKKAKERVELLEKQEKSGKIKLSELNPGDVFQTTGKRKYKVLEQYENTTKIVSFNLVKENVKFGDNADYLESELKELCLEIQKAGKPYKFIAIDTVSTLEDFAKPIALANYKKTPAGANYEGDILLAPMGSGR